MYIYIYMYINIYICIYINIYTYIFIYTKSEVTWCTAHEHIVADPFRSRNLRRAYQRSLFMNSKHQKSDAFQVTHHSSFNCLW